MEKKLKWNAIGLETKTLKLLENLKIVKENMDPSHSAKIRKVQGFIDDLQDIISTIDRIKNDLIPKLEDKFRLKFKTPEMIFIALSRPALRSIFLNLNAYFSTQNLQPLTKEDFNELAASGDTSNVLALIGDSAIKLALVETFWDSSHNNAGQLTITKAAIESNENMAKMCDEFNLYDNTLCGKSLQANQNSKEKTIIHEKGTLVEAIFGVIYLEFGFEELCRLKTLLQ